MNQPARPFSARLGLIAASIVFLVPLLLLPYTQAAGPLSAQAASGSWQPVGLRGERILTLSVTSSSGEGLLYAETPTGWWRYRVTAFGGQVSGWQRLDAALPHTSLGGPALAAWRVVPGRGRQLYALTGAGTARLLYRSDDGGDSWNMIGPAPGQTARPAMIVFPGPAGTPDTIIVATDTRIQRSTDGGATWAPGGTWPRLQSESPRQSDGKVTVFDLRQTVYALLGDSSTPERLYALGARGDFWLSETGGLAWRTPSPPFPPSPQVGEQEKVTALAIAPHFGVRIWAAMPDRMAYSTDSGGNWTTLPLPRPHARITHLLVDPRVPDTLYASLADGAVYRSDDAGASWTPLGKPGPARAGALALNPDTRGQLYAATEDGVWVRPVVAPQPTALPVEAVKLSPTGQPATPAATLTLSATPTASATSRPAATPTATSSPSPSPTLTPTPTATPSATPTNSPTRRPSRTPSPTQPAATPTEVGELTPPTAAPREPAPTARPPTAPPPTATNAPPTALPPTATAAPPTATPPFFTPEPR
jgi:hypothetical protein